jgi:hypothetical protein
VGVNRCERDQQHELLEKMLHAVAFDGDTAVKEIECGNPGLIGPSKSALRGKVLF